MIFGIIKISYVILYIVLINCIGLGIMALDKYKAQRSYRRIPEKTLFLITFLGGGIGTIAGMYMFRHKTKKIQFYIGFPTIVICEIALIIFFYTIGK